MESSAYTPLRVEKIKAQKRAIRIANLKRERAFRKKAKRNIVGQHKANVRIAFFKTALPADVTDAIAIYISYKIPTSTAGNATDQALNVRNWSPK